MTHEPYHAILLGTGALYYAGAMYYAFRNYQLTSRDGFWFFMVLFVASMTGVMVAGALWSLRIINETNIHPYFDTLFLTASLFLFVAAYTLRKKHHKVKVF